MTGSNTPLTDDELRQIRAEIERQLRKLERSMAVTDEAMKPVVLDQTVVGRLSRIDSLQNQGMTRNLRDRERTRLAQLANALQRLERGTLGVCESCGAPIGFERLLLFPEGVTCATCAVAGA